ncbi:MAG: leucyl aminopeptidase [archaeon]
MKITVKSGKPESLKTELLIIGSFEKEKFTNKILDNKLKGRISKAVKEKKFEGEFKQLFSVSSLGTISAEKVLLVGLGKRKEFTIEKLRRIAGFTAKVARDGKINNFITTLVETDVKDKTTEEKALAVTEGMLLGIYEFTKYKTDKKAHPHMIKEAIIVTNEAAKVNKGVKKGIILSEATNYARDLVNMPAGDATPTFLADEAKKAAKNYGIKIKVLGKKEMEKKKMNSILGVSRGSSQEPKLVVMETNPSAKKKIAFVGKGITFDSGGLDLKPFNYMTDMKCDMAGSAAVLGAVIAAAKLKLPVNILGVMVLSENMPGQSAQKPGDIITAYNKKTIEILNTDAEGRLVLADAVAYAEEQKPIAIVDIATLTGAVVVSLGYSAAGLVSSNDKLKEALKKAGDETHERVWELPLWDEFREAVKGDIGDVRNVGKGKGYEAGTVIGGTFIEQFVKKTPWAHIDIGGTGWFLEPSDYIPKDGTGFGVRLFINLIENWK